MTTRTICTMKPAAELRTPELTATVGGRPCFWKKRIDSVALPAVPPTSPVKALANWTHGDRSAAGAVLATAPSMATAWLNGGSWARTSVTTTHSQIAPSNTSPMAATPASWTTRR